MWVQSHAVNSLDHYYFWLLTSSLKTESDICVFAHLQVELRKLQGCSVFVRKGLKHVCFLRECPVQCTRSIFNTNPRWLLSDWVMSGPEGQRVWVCPEVHQDTRCPLFTQATRGTSVPGSVTASFPAQTAALAVGLKLRSADSICNPHMFCWFVQAHWKLQLTDSDQTVAKLCIHR